MLLHGPGWSSWTFEPTVLAGILIAAALYWRELGRESDVPWWRPLVFAAGLITIFLALASPLDEGADDYLLLLHMTQHALLGTVAPPLLLLGLTPRMVTRLAELPVLRHVLVLTQPLIAASLFIANMWFWHVPAVYDAAIDNLALHIAMHVCFLGAGLLYWWPVLLDAPPQARTSIPTKLIYLLVTGFPMGLLAVFLFASPDVLYSHYESTPRMWGISPLTDQQLAGLIMGVFGETASFVAFTYFFYRLMEEGDADEEEALRAMAAGQPRSGGTAP